MNASYPIEIYDSYGKKIFAKSFATTSISIKELNLTKGIYILKIEYPNGKNETQKLVVE